MHFVQGKDLRHINRRWVRAPSGYIFDVFLVVLAIRREDRCLSSNPMGGLYAWEEDGAVCLVSAAGNSVNESDALSAKRLKSQGSDQRMRILWSIFIPEKW